MRRSDHPSIGLDLRLWRKKQPPAFDATNWVLLIATAPNSHQEAIRDSNIID